MPMLAEMDSSVPASTNGLAMEARSFSAMTAADPGRSRSVSTTMNSSPPNRASVSSARIESRMRPATARNKSSPTPCPRPSLICLKLSRSTNSSPTRPSWRAARSSAWSSRSTPSRRLGKFVSASWCARCCSFSSARRTVVMSVHTITRWPATPLWPGTAAMLIRSGNSSPPPLQARTSPRQRPAVLRPSLIASICPAGCASGRSR